MATFPQVALQQWHARLGLVLAQALLKDGATKADDKGTSG